MATQARIFQAANCLRRETWISLGFAVLALTWFLVYPFYYDDAFISFRISRNIAEGLGPYHNLVEKVQTNTSLLYPFLVAPFQFLSRNWAVKVNTGFDFFLGFLVVGQVWIALRRHPGFAKMHLGSRTRFAFWINLAFYANRMLVPGMETQLYMLGLLLTWNAFEQGKTYAFPLGFALSFIRPEGALLAIIFWLSGQWTIGIRVKSLVAALLLASVYLSLQWHFFGSLVPHTLAVKALIEPELGNSLWHFVVHIFLPYRYPLVLLVHLVGTLFLAQQVGKRNYQTLSLFLLIYALVFCVLAGGNAFFGWYQSPLKVFLLLAAGWQCIEWWPVLERNGLTISLGICLAVVPVLYEQVRFRQDGIFKAATDLANLTRGKKWSITCEPMGVLGYYNPHIQFTDYPGLASARSLNLLKKYGPIRRSNYFKNEAFRQIILQGKADLVLLSPPEAKAFETIMANAPFVFLGKIGIEKISEHNSAFFVWLNQTQVSKTTEAELKRKAKELNLQMP